jgi:hypothetical protein
LGLARDKQKPGHDLGEFFFGTTFILKFKYEKPIQKLFFGGRPYALHGQHRPAAAVAAANQRRQRAARAPKARGAWLAPLGASTRPVPPSPCRGPHRPRQCPKGRNLGRS